MGFFDRLIGKKASTPAPTPSAANPAASSPAPAPISTADAPAPAPDATAPAKPALAGGVMPQLAAARAKLDARDPKAALAIYEQVIASAGDRADVLLTASGDLGSHGNVRELIELIGPRYDAERHGHGPGLNLLQAYLAVGNIESAQHVLDLLFSLNRPEIESRLVGFSRAIAEMSASGTVPDEATPAEAAAKPREISLVSISKPVWFYGLEAHAESLLPRKEGRLRRVAFAQCALLGDPAVMERAKQPEDETGRFSRGLALWLAETFFYSAGYEPFAGVGLFAPEHYALFPAEWTADNVRQMSESTEGGLDYVITSSLKNRNADFELTLRIWEVKKFRQLKSFSTRWTPGNADAVLAEFHQQIRTYMEWSALPAGNGLAYTPPAAPIAHVQALGGSLGLFFVGKQLLPLAHAPQSAELFLRNVQVNPGHVPAQLTLITALQRQQAAGIAPDVAALAQAKAWLDADAAKAAGLGGIPL